MLRQKAQCILFSGSNYNQQTRKGDTLQVNVEAKVTAAEFSGQSDQPPMVSFPPRIRQSHGVPELVINGADFNTKGNASHKTKQ